MRFFLLLLTDIALILAATLFAVILRDNFEISHLRLVSLAPYFALTTAAAASLLPIFGVTRAIWRFTTLPDYLRISGAIIATVVCTVVLVFVFNRLDGVPRSLPFLQFNVAMIVVIGVRVIYRLHYTARQRKRQKFAPLKVVDEPAHKTVLLVGLSLLTEAYLQSVAEFAPHGIRVAGILGRKHRHVGRLVASHKVLGLPEHLDRVLDELDVSGIAVDRIVIAMSSSLLSREGREAIAAVQRHRSVQIQYLAEELGFETKGLIPTSPPPEIDDISDGAQMKFEIQVNELEMMQMRPYWKVKRAIDVVASLLLLVISTPVLLSLAACVALTMGWPLVFWQQRPGLGGRPFRLYKFRTMGSALGADGRKLTDEERVSSIGNLLRRTRFDELPQLFNIVRGDMSFIGPRPLLPRDQHDDYRARLLVRPGLSGWAQVVGGRTISAQDKAALDVWYVQNASLLLDIAVVLRTIPMVFLGERISDRLIDRAWHDLRNAGVLKGQLSDLHSTNSPLTA